MPSRETRDCVLRTLPSLLALALVAAAFLPVLANDLVLDDTFLVEGAKGLGDPSALADMLRRPFWQNSSYVTELLHDYWRPVTTLLLWITAFFAERSPVAFHALSLLGLAAAAFSLRALLVRFAPPGGRTAATWLALVFAAHPLAAEVVGMAANVSDHLVMAFLSLQIIALDAHFRERRSRWLAAAALFGSLACGAKETGLVGALAPLAALLLARGSGADVPRRAWLSVARWATAVVPAIVYLALRSWVADRAGWTATAWPSTVALAAAIGQGPGWALRAFAIPAPGGTHVYARFDDALAWCAAAVAWIGAAGVIAAAFARRRPLGLGATGLLFALALLLPSLLGVDAMEGDGRLRFPIRYFHLPLAGALLALLPTVARLWERGLRLAAPLAVALLAVLSWMRVDEWRDGVSFFTAEAAYHPESLPDRLNAISALTHAHAFAAAEAQLEGAARLEGAGSPHFRARLLNERAAILVLRDGELERAEALLREAIAVDPGDLGSIFDLAAIRMTSGDRRGALSILDDALASPRFGDYRRNAIEERILRYSTGEAALAP